VQTGRPLRFCLFATFYPPWSFGGDGMQVQRLARVLADRGHRVTVVCSPAAHRLLAREARPSRDFASPALPRESPENGSVEVVPMSGGPASLLGRYLTGRPVGAGPGLDQLLGRDFDVLHFHNPSLLGAPRLLTMGEGIKLYTVHEQWLLCPSHVLWRGDHVCESPPCWSCEVRHGRPPQPWRRTLMLERSLRHLDALIAPSRTAADLHRRFAEQVRIEVLPHFAPEPTPIDRLAPAEPRLAPDRPYFLYAGRLESIKGVGGLIEAFRRRRSEDLVIAGEGRLARSLRRSAADLPNVHFVGWVDQEGLDGLYRDALAVVMPTLGHEVMGLVALEAFARGTPVVVNRFGALAELAAATGGAIAYGSPDELDSALERIASDASLRQALGRRGRAACSDRFSVESHLRDYLQLIARLARERGDEDLAAAADSSAATVHAGAGAGG
jgi:glycosyltransferase involved in cell wall biosynthesis